MFITFFRNWKLRTVRRLLRSPNRYLTGEGADRRDGIERAGGVLRSLWQHRGEHAQGREQGHTFIPPAQVVKSGVVRVMQLEEQGWTYVKP